MKKVLMIAIMMMFMASPSFGKTNIKMGGRIAPDSPTDFRPGKNKVWFLSEGAKVVGNLYLPDTYKKGQKLPAIVVVGPKGSVKEQTAGIYAKKTISERLYNACF